MDYIIVAVVSAAVGYAVCYVQDHKAKVQAIETKVDSVAADVKTVVANVTADVKKL